MHLRSGERVTVRHLLTGAAVASGNDAITALALRVGGNQRQFVRAMYDICKSILPKAKAVVNIGTCACYGGVQAAKPNPTAAKGVNECFASLGIKGINIPGCPPNPLNMVGALVAFLQGQKIELDELGRPLMGRPTRCNHARTLLPLAVLRYRPNSPLQKSGEPGSARKTPQARFR